MLVPSTVDPSYPQFGYLWFKLPAANYCPKILKGKFQKKIIGFKPHAVLSSMMTPSIILLHPAWHAIPLPSKYMLDMLVSE